MTQPLESPPPPPQTAAELLAGLLRSQLFAESLFGQVLEQSRPYLDRPAGEYADALVEKRVLTRWHATELLAGRVGLYAGTFRLLERLAGTEEAQWFAAEQGGVQRLVLLQITRSRLVDDAAAIKSSVVVGPQLTAPRQPHLPRCIAVQRTARLRLVAYEFLEARPLAELMATEPIQRTHAAQVASQFASTLAVLRDEIIETIGLSAMWIDSQGQLQLLAGPNPLVSDSGLGQPSPQRESLQLAAVQRFATALGGLPKIANCRLMIEALQRLSEMAKPWIAPFESASLLCPRARMNRHLRRGPAPRLIETFGVELQLVLAGPGEETSRIPSLDEDRAPAVIEAVISSIPSAVRGRSRSRAWAVLVLVVAAVMAAQWSGRWRSRPAEATTEEVIPRPATGR